MFLCVGFIFWHLSRNCKIAGAVPVLKLVGIIIVVKAAWAVPLQGPVLLPQCVAPACEVATQQRCDQMHVRQSLLPEVDTVHDVYVPLELLLGLTLVLRHQSQPKFAASPHLRR